MVKEVQLIQPEESNLDLMAQGDRQWWILRNKQGYLEENKSVAPNYRV